jgi:glutathione S-transferase
MKVELYHNGLSTCSQKVRLALAEKGVVWASREIELIAGAHKQPDYMKLNPKGVVPTLVIDDIPIVESNIINEYIDDAFDGPALKPPDPIARAKMRLFNKHVEDETHPASGIVTYSTVMRQFQLHQPREDVLAGIEKSPTAHERAVRRSLFEHGVEAPECQAAIATLGIFVARLELVLGENEWVAGDQFSLADCAAAPYVLRNDHLGMSALWADGAMPNVARWFAALVARPSFAEAVTKWADPSRIALFKSAGQLIWPRFEHLLRPGA